MNDDWESLAVFALDIGASTLQTAADLLPDGDPLPRATVIAWLEGLAGQWRATPPQSMTVLIRAKAGV